VGCALANREPRVDSAEPDLDPSWFCVVRSHSNTISIHLGLRYGGVFQDIGTETTCSNRDPALQGRRLRESIPSLNVRGTTTKGDGGRQLAECRVGKHSAPTTAIAIAPTRLPILWRCV
jgi:hypothetical protein